MFVVRRAPKKQPLRIIGLAFQIDIEVIDFKTGLPAKPDICAIFLSIAAIEGNFFTITVEGVQLIDHSIKIVRMDALNKGFCQKIYPLPAKNRIPTTIDICK